MSCPAAQAPRLAGARSCCPSRADSVLHQAGTTSHILLLGSSCSQGSVVKPTRSSLLHQCFPWGFLCAFGLVQPQYPAPAASLCFREKVNQEYRQINLPSHLTLDKPIGSSSACISNITELLPGKDTSKVRERRFVRRHDSLFLSFLTLRVRRTSEHCRHETTSFVGHISV